MNTLKSTSTESSTAPQIIWQKLEKRLKNFFNNTKLIYVIMERRK